MQAAIRAGVLCLLALAASCGSPADARPVAGEADVPSVAELPLSSSTPAPTAMSLPSPTPAPTPTAPAPTVTPPPTPSRATPAKRPIAVVVENDPAARPQNGLGEADVIYEAVAEWDLTRFVAVFTDAALDVVGPVRSGRAYHVALAAEYGAALAHCLAVPTVAKIVEATAVVDLDGCAVMNPIGFKRDWNRRMPHNLYVSVPLLQDVAGGNGSYGALAKREPWTAAGAAIARIAFVYPAGHPVAWQFDPYRGEYRRWQDGAPHVDAGGNQIATSALAVQFVAIKNSAYYGEAGYHELTLTGEGDALLYAAGTKRVARWRRPALDGPTRFFDAAGEEILLPPGRVFVQLVAPGTAIQESN